MIKRYIIIYNEVNYNLYIGDESNIFWDENGDIN